MFLSEVTEHDIAVTGGSAYVVWRGTRTMWVTNKIFFNFPSNALEMWIG